MSNIRVEVRGIRELNGALKQVDSQLPKKLKEGLKEIAGKVASRAKSKVPVMTGRAQSSIRPRATTRGAGIAFGGNAAPYYPWLDFGGRVGINKSVSRPFIQQGRYIYPTIKEMNNEIMKQVDEVIEEVVKDARFETRK